MRFGFCGFPFLKRPSFWGGRANRAQPSFDLTLSACLWCIAWRWEGTAIASGLNASENRLWFYLHYQLLWGKGGCCVFPEGTDWLCSEMVCLHPSLYRWWLWSPRPQQPHIIACSHTSHTCDVCRLGGCAFCLFFRDTVCLQFSKAATRLMVFARGWAITATLFPGSIKSTLHNSWVNGVAEQERWGHQPYKQAAGVCCVEAAFPLSVCLLNHPSLSAFKCAWFSIDHLGGRDETVVTSLTGPFCRSCCLMKHYLLTAVVEELSLITWHFALQIWNWAGCFLRPPALFGVLQPSFPILDLASVLIQLCARGKQPVNGIQFLVSPGLPCVPMWLFSQD